MDIVTVMERIVDTREQMNGTCSAAKRQMEELLGALQQELANHVPSDATEAFMMATEVTYMLEDGSDPERAARIARSMTDGLMALSRNELAAYEVGAPSPLQLQ